MKGASLPTAIMSMVNSTTRAFGSPLRYIQGAGEFENIDQYVSSYGGKACYLIDAFLFETIRIRLDDIYAKAPDAFFSIPFGGECCASEVDRITGIAQEKGAKVIAGVGGGKTLDTAKLSATAIDLPVIIVPTSASTDAPVSEIAVIYSEAGEHLGSQKMKRNADLVLVDSQIIIGAPKRLFVAGMGDALATWFEAQANAASDSPNYVGTGYRRCIAGMAIAKACYETLLKDGKRALMALDRGVVTEAVDNIIEANTLLSGLGFHNTGLSASHGIHAGLTAVPSAHSFLHGEKVAFGIMCQIILENTLSPAEVDELVRFMADIDLPITLGQLGVEASHENVMAIARKTTLENKLIYAEPFKITTELVYNSILAADELGKQYLPR